MKITMTSNQELKEDILAKLQKNKIQFGERYCPCVSPKFYDTDHICPCKSFREQDSGTCHCGLYNKDN